jgi:RNA polymerase sigma-70 factor (ECF subfamily)
VPIPLFYSRPSVASTLSENVNLDDDVQAMLRLKGGEDGALNELMERWQNPLVSFIFRYVGNREEALDLAQETFVRVFEHSNSYEPRSKFSTWLFTIATNLCRDQARWRKRHPSVTLHGFGEDDDPTVEDTTPASGDTPAESAERLDLVSAVRRHIRDLPHDLRTVIILFEYQDLGYEEIAETLGCSPKAVEMRLHRARRALREALAREKITTAR